MFTTPAEAKKLTCPHMRYVTNEAGVINDGHSAIHYQANCMANECMAWRWQSALTVNNPSQRPGAAVQKIERNAGFCGLAGRP